MNTQSRYRIKFKHGDLEGLRARLLADLSREHFAVLLGKTQKIDGYTIINVIDLLFPARSDYNQQSVASLRIKKDFIHKALVELTNRYDVDTIIDVHTHPFSQASVSFSATDDGDEKTFFRFLKETFAGIHYASIVFSQGKYSARVWTFSSGSLLARKALLKTQTSRENIASSDFREDTDEHDEKTAMTGEEGFFHRSASVLGLDVMRTIMHHQVISIVGVGGLGSIVAEHLIHMGFHEINLIDPDVLEVSNLNRVVGAYYKDAQQQRSKVDVVKRHLTNINPNATVLSCKNDIHDKEMESVLALSDWMIVATDNHSSRLKVQELSVKYFVPLLSLGVNITVKDGTIDDMSGEVITARVGDYLCLNCLNRINPIKVASERHPDQTIREALVKRGYVTGKDIKEPAVKTLNTFLATMAVEVLINQYTDVRRHVPVLVYENNGSMSMYEDRESVQLRNKQCFLCNVCSLPCIISYAWKVSQARQMKEKKALETQRPRQVPRSGSQTWSSIQWRMLEQHVLHIQKGIYRASQSGDRRAVHSLQQQLIESEAARLLAVRRATEENDGKDTAGIDGVKSLTPKERLAMVSTIHPANWSQQPPRPVRRVWLPKPGTAERRPLAILPMIDRCKQALVKLALEPEWEAKFEPHSYGFRPDRGAQDAIRAIMHALKQQSSYVFDADIEAAFDSINQAVLLEKLQTYPALRQAIDVWLKAGVVDRGTYLPSDTGISQGGALSPLLMNIALHGMEAVVRGDHAAGPGIQPPLLVRYADDFVVLHSHLQELQQAGRRIRPWLARMGLQLNAHKTRITHTLTPFQGQAGFDFLGFTIRQYPREKPAGKSPGFQAILTPSEEASKRHLAVISQRLLKLQAAPQAQVIRELNPIIVGWAAYYNGIVSAEAMSRYDEQVEHLLLNWASKRHPNKARDWLLNRYWQRVGKREWVFTAPEGAQLRTYQQLSSQDRAR